jgi:hypothetical protein
VCYIERSPQGGKQSGTPWKETHTSTHSPRYMERERGCARFVCCAILQHQTHYANLTHSSVCLSGEIRKVFLQIWSPTTAQRKIRQHRKSICLPPHSLRRRERERKKSFLSGTPSNLFLVFTSVSDRLAAPGAKEK